MYNYNFFKKYINYILILMDNIIENQLIPQQGPTGQFGMQGPKDLKEKWGYKVQ